MLVQSNVVTSVDLNETSFGTLQTLLSSLVELASTGLNSTHSPSIGEKIIRA